MITFRIGHSRPQDGATTYAADWNGQLEIATPDAGTPKLCRRLVAAGCPDQPWEARDGTTGELRFSGPSLRRPAQLRITERDRRGMRVERLRPAAVTYGIRSTVPAADRDAPSQADSAEQAG
jgi:hypothetical protein